MPQRFEVTEFLRSRRARITPDQVGVAGHGRRRVPGLRREEIAAVAGVSVDYYARMERGDLSGVSPEVLRSVAQALRLDEAETAYLNALARAAHPHGAPDPPRPAQLPPGLRRFLESATGAAVWVRDRRLDFVAANALGRALYGPILTEPANRANTARFMFLDPTARTFFPDWEKGADDIVATLRCYHGEAPDDLALAALITELNEHSDEFRRRWARHNVRFHRAGIKRIIHPAVGDLEVIYEAMTLHANPDWFVFMLSAAAEGSVTEQRLRMLEADATASLP